MIAWFQPVVLFNLIFYYDYRIGLVGEQSKHYYIVASTVYAVACIVLPVSKLDDDTAHKVVKETYDDWDRVTWKTVRSCHR